MAQTDKDRMARLKPGFDATVLSHGPIMIEPAWDTMVHMRADGDEPDDRPVAVSCPDPLPAVGARVHVDARGKITLL